MVALAISTEKTKQEKDSINYKEKLYKHKLIGAGKSKSYSSLYLCMCACMSRVMGQKRKQKGIRIAEFHLKI